MEELTERMLDRVHASEITDFLERLYPQADWSGQELLQLIQKGSLWEALQYLIGSIKEALQGELSGCRNLFLTLLLFGIFSALLTQATQLLENRQVTDLGFYFLFLLFGSILIRSFALCRNVATEAIENTSLVVRLSMPTYLLTVGISAGSGTAVATCQLLLLILYGTELLLLRVCLPLINVFFLLIFVNSLWEEQRLSFLIRLIHRGIGWIQKTAIGIVTGVSFFQSLIHPIMDNAKRSALEKFAAGIPGVGRLAGGTLDLLLGSAVVVRNSVGMLIIIGLGLVCLIPLCKLFVISGCLKLAAAFIHVVSDKRISVCANRTGEAGLLLLKTTGVGIFLFLIALAVVSASLRV